MGDSLISLALAENSCLLPTTVISKGLRMIQSKWSASINRSNLSLYMLSPPCCHIFSSVNILAGFHHSISTIFIISHFLHIGNVLPDVHMDYTTTALSKHLELIGLRCRQISHIHVSPNGTFVRNAERFNLLRIGLPNTRQKRIPNCSRPIPI